ncbi:tetratricopeptide repeat protein [Paractinoplanes brasiliensis]|uniref:ATP/maltotriose-dependent transcriptional regulator MalT n=1 Tax=Paractinoplanes brasiliensis TaxID=52695 RepID=A0A4R6JBR8_9ACTN|nr:tetratricopeptide repeat protein [Actinoplanes brasiliensis]TDO33159.1 ATP/maltotriose-dependent transcriptional regulator MalT [Actinoplanes brasiliensis]
MAYDALPDPAGAGAVDDLVERLRLLKVWAGDPSYGTILSRVNEAWTAAGRPASELTRRSTVADCFRPGRRRLNTDLIMAVVSALHPEPDYVDRWRQALRTVTGESEAVAQVRVRDSLPQDLPGFTGREVELERLRREPVCLIEGMAGVGKTQLAVHAGHLLGPFERVLFVNLRGFHPDPAQPPAGPAAVLDGFLRLLGVPSQRIPRTPAGRAELFRELLSGVRGLVVLDNADSEEQVRPLLPGPDCLTLITSRRRLPVGTPLEVDVFTPGEAATFLAAATGDAPAAPDPEALGRIAERCGRLPLALSLLAGHITSLPGWTLADHADRLDDRHRDRRLDTGVELALDLSYRHLPPEQQRLLRLAALHPGQEFDAYAVAALAGIEPPDARRMLEQLGRDHLLQPAAAGRYVLHDLVRAYAVTRTRDEDPPRARRAALTRLFDFYVATTTAATNVVYPDEAYRRRERATAGPPGPDLPSLESAVAWLEAERHSILAVAAHTATQGWPGHTVTLAEELYRYLAGGHPGDALTLFTHAVNAARERGDPAEQALVVLHLGFTHLLLGHLEEAAEHFRQSLGLMRETGDVGGQARVLYNLSMVDQRTGKNAAAAEQLRQALELYRRAGDPVGEGNGLCALSIALDRMGQFAEAADLARQSLEQAVARGSVHGQAYALIVLGDIETRTGCLADAGEHLRQALTLYGQLGNTASEANVLDSLGLLHTRMGKPDEAAGFHEQSLRINHELGSTIGEMWALNGLGEAAQEARRPEEALAHHTAALGLADEASDYLQEARAHAGLGRARQALGDVAQARDHYERALAIYTECDAPEAGAIHALLTTA